VRVVAVVNQKGGVAKTTTVANLGACIAERGYRTLLIDLDPQANLTVGLGVPWHELDRALHTVLLDPDDTPLQDVLHQIEGLPLYLVPAHLDLAHAEATMLPHADKAYRLRNAIEDLTRTEQFDWVFIDCPPSLGTLTQNAIVAASHLLIPTEPKLYAFAGMDSLNKMIVSLTRSLRFRVELLGVLLTLFERGTRLHAMIASEIRQRFGDKVFQTVIYKNVRVSESELEGRPIALYDRKAPGAQNYEALAEEVLLRAAG
jgi:chromosome partitioning protein